MRRIAVALVLVSIVANAFAQTNAVSSSRRRSVRHLPPALPAPTAVVDSYAVDQGNTLNVAAPGVLANDTLNGAALASYGPSTGGEQSTIGASVPTSNGTLTIAATGAFTYTPQATFSGTDSFVYFLRNNGGGSASATVTITVRPSVQVTAIADSYTTSPDNDLSVPAPGVLTNDTLAGATIVSVGPRDGTEKSIATPSPTASGGIITLSADGSFLYNTPPAVEDSYGYSRSFTGVDSFSYVIRNGSISSTASVNVLVTEASSGADFVVTTPGHYYAISGLSGENPVLTLKRGRTYTFQIDAASIHPFAILDAPAGTVTNNNITSGTLTFIVPSSAQTYRYRCTTHGFGNVINTEP